MALLWYLFDFVYKKSVSAPPVADHNYLALIQPLSFISSILINTNTTLTFSQSTATMVQIATLAVALVAAASGVSAHKQNCRDGVVYCGLQLNGQPLGEKPSQSLHC